MTCFADPREVARLANSDDPDERSVARDLISALGCLFPSDCLAAARCWQVATPDTGADDG
jgi:hypothetical protein